MNPNFVAVKSKLPDHVISALESKRGDAQQLQELLEMYKRNGFTTAADNLILFQEFMIPAEQKAATAQVDAQFEREYLETFAVAKRRSELEAQYKKTSGGVIFIIMAVFLIFVGIGMAASFSNEEVKEPKNFAEKGDGIITFDDYFIEDAYIAYQYAELFESDGKDKNKDGEKDVTSVTKDFYLAVVTDDDGAEYLLSLSFDHNSELAKELRNFDFEDDYYVLSGYFRPKSLSGYTGSAKNSETLADIYNEETELYMLDGYEKAEKNFEFLYPEDADYYEEEEKEKGNNTMIGVFIGLFGVAMVFMGINNIRKKKKIKNEMAEIDKNFAAKVAAKNNIYNQQ